MRFTFPFNLISTSTLAFFTANQGTYSNLGTQLGKENKDSLSQPNLTRIQFRLWCWLVEKSNNYTTINRKGTPFEDLVFRGPDQPNLIPRVPSYSELERTLVATKLVSPLAHKNTSK